MSFRELLTSLQFTAAEMASLVRCAFKEQPSVQLGDQPQYVKLESRTLYSAAPIAVDAVADVDEGMTDELAAQAVGIGELESADQFDQADQNAEAADSAPLDEQPTGRAELVLVDASTQDYQQLVDDILAQQSNGRQIDVRVLDSAKDGIEQVSELLKDYQNLDAIHLVSHGSDGAVKLGSNWLDPASIAGYVSDIVGWRDALADDADLLIYGCDLADSAEGRTLIDMLAMVCDCDVAASDDDTGDAALGGDWEFEYFVGVVDSPIAFSIDVQSEWHSLLAATVTSFQEGVSGYTGTLDTYLDAGEPSTVKGSSSSVQIDLFDGGTDPTTQGLIRFNNLFGNGAGQIPVGSTIASASLTVNVTNTSAAGATIGLHQMLVNWSESSTWNTLSSGVSTNGVEAAVTADSTLSDPSQSGTVTFNGLQSTIQDWLDGTSTNYGWVITTNNTNGWDFDSSEAASTSLRPKLQVTYTTAGDPTIILPTGTLEYYEGAPAAIIDASATVTDTNSADFETGTLTVDFAANGTANDRLAVRNQGTAAGQIGVSGNTITFGGTAIGTFTGGTNGSTPLVISFNANSTPAATQALVQGITYENVSADPSTATRTVRFVINDGDGVTGNYATLDIDVKQYQADGVALWRENGTSTPEYNLYNGTSFGTEGNSGNLGNWQFMQGAEAPTRDETIVVGIGDGDKKVRGQLWDGNTWTDLSINDIGTAKVTGYWSVDVAYEQLSGDAIIVWDDNATLKYSVWNGTSWSAKTTLSAYSGGEPRQLHLAAKPDSDEMVLTITDKDKKDYALVWNGSTWGNAVTLSTTTSQDLTDVSVAYEQQSGHAMVVYAKDQTDVHYRIWNGSSWSAEGTITAPSGPGNKARWTMLDSDPNSDRIVLGVLTESKDAYFAVWDGSAWNSGDKLFATNSANERTYPNIAVAFESESGQAIATYNTDDNFVRYRTWTSGSGWSGELIGPDLGAKPTSMTLDSDPKADRIMLSVLDEAKDVNFVLWDGTSWGTPAEQEVDAGQSDVQPFVFVWDQDPNEAPILSDTVITLNSVLEDAGAPSGGVGTLIMDLVDLNSRVGGQDNVTDGDSGAVTGVAITAADTTNGTWYYTTNGGSTWNLLGAVSNSSARLLAADANTRIYFQANTNYNGSIANALTFRAWDQTDDLANGTAGVNTSTNGGRTAYSTASDSASLVVTPVNDAPVASDSSVSVTEDVAYVFSASDFGYSDIEGDALSKIQITELPTNGALRLNGVLVVADQEISRANIDAGLFTFTTAANMNGVGVDTFFFRLHDGTEYSVSAALTSHLSASFDSNADGFVYADLVNGSWANGVYDAAGGSSGGGLRINLAGGVTGGTTTGRWLNTFTLTETTDLTISTDYRLVMSSEYESNEYGDLILQVNGVAYGNDANTSLIHQVGDGNGGSVFDSGWQTYQTTLTLGAGTHTIALISTNNASTEVAEYVTGYFDNVSVSSSRDAIMTVDAAAVNDAPTIATNTGMTVSEGSTGNAISTGMLNEGDVDDSGAGLTYTYTSVTINGTLKKNGTALGLNDTFTQADIDGGLIEYDHDGSNTTSDSFQFSLADGGEDGSTPTAGTFNITVTSVNSSPTVATNTGSTVDEGSAGNVLTTAMLNEGDADDSGTGLTYTVTSLTANGTLRKNGTALGLNDTFTQADIDGGLITYDHDGSETASDSFDFSLADGGENGSTPATGTFNFTINAINDDPLNSGSLPSNIVVMEDIASNVDLSAINLSDADHNGGNLTVTLMTGTGGNLSSSTGGGVTVGGSGTGTLTLTGTLANLNSFLDTASNITYLESTPHTFGNDADTITVVVNDNGNTGSGGGTNQNLGTVNVDITAVNDEQVLAVNTGATVAEGSTGNVVTGSMLETNDVDNTDDQMVYTVDVAPVNGTLFRNGVALSATDTFTQADIFGNLITYDHDDSQTSSDSFDFTVDDGAGTTTSATFNWTVTNVNDAPVQASIEGAALAYTENDGAVAITSTLAVSDVDDTHIEAAVVQITGNYANGEDVLSFTDQNGITGTWTTGTGTLSLSGSATLAQYEAALRSITYTNTSDNPSTLARTISFTVNDGDVNSNTLTRDITLGSVNDDPTNAGSLPTDITVTEDVSSNVDLSAIDLSDVDHGGSNLTVTLSTSTGGNLSATTAGGVTVGGSGTGTLTLTGTLASLNTFLDTASNVQYLHSTAHLNGDDADTISVTVNDNGNTGSGGGGNIALGSVNVDISAVNDTPVNTVPGTQSVVEETATSISGLSIADVDAASGNLTTRLQVTNGVLNVTLSGSASISAGSNASSDLTIQGSVTDINATLASLTYTGNTDVTGTAADTLTVTTNDGGNTGSGGALQDEDNIQIDITAVNDTPVVSGPGSAYAATEQINLTIEGTGFTVSDVDAASGSMTATIAVGEGAITVVAGDSGVSISGGNGTGTVTLTGTLSQLDNLLTGAGTGTITYLNSSDTPSASTTITVTVNDGGNTGTDPGLTGDGSSEQDFATQTINITATNDDPTNAGSLPSDISVVEDVGSNVDLSAINLSDVDHGGGNLTVTLSTSTSGNLSASSGGGVTIGGSGTGTLTLTGTLASLNTFLDTASNVQYLHSTAHLNGDNADTISVVVNDLGNTGTGGGTNQNLGTVNVDISAVNDAPVNTVPGTQSVAEETVTAISGISIADVDAGGSSLTTRLQVSNGVLNVTLSGSASISAGSNGTGDLTIQGSVTDINATLASLTYTGDTDVVGTAADTLIVTTNDQGNTGSGGALQDVDNIQIDITAVNDTPVVSGPGSAYSATEQVALTIEGTGFTVSDVDAASGSMTATIVVGEGAITVLAGDSGVSISGGNGTGSVTLTGTLSQLDNLLTGSGTGTITYLNSSDTPSASTTITVTVNDGGNTGADPGLTGDGTSEQDFAAQTINITAINDDPTNAGSLPSDISVTEDVSSDVDLSSINLSDVDHGGGNLTVTSATSTGGNLSASSGGGVTVAGSGTNTLTLTGTLASLNTFLDTASNVQYLHSTVHLNGNDSDTITVTVNDNGNTGSGGGGNIALGVVNVDITAVNDAPVVDNSGNTILATITEDDTGNAGQSVAAIVASAGGDRITDVDAGAIEGIAITGLSSGNGTWEYSVNGGTNWNSVGSVSDSAALLLRATDLVRFVPNAENATTADFTFRAWDQTSGSFGATVDVSANGGTTAFSSATETASITVTAVNDAPSITGGATVNLPSTNEDSPSNTTAVSLILGTSGWADVDSGALQGLAVHSLTGNGTWQYSTDGTNWTSFGAVSSTNALLLNSTTLVRYAPDGENGETAQFGYQAWDRTTGSASSFGSPFYADASTAGGTTAYSSQAATAQIVVTSVNDAAIANSDTGTGDEAGGYNNGTPGSDPTGNVLANDTDVDIGDTMNVTGVAAGIVASASGNVGSAVAGTYGSISIAANGAYTYTVDNNNPVVQALRTSGQTLDDTFTYTLTDSGGAPATTQVVITIRGANDAPTTAVDNPIAVEQGGVANGSAGTNPSGNAITNDGDVDSGDSLTVIGVQTGVVGSASGNVGASLAGTYGAITLNASGAYTYVVDNANSTVQALRTSAETLSDVFTYTLQDASGLTSTTQVTVTIQGQNDTPVAVDDAVVAVEAGGLSNSSPGTDPTGNVVTNDSDVDSGDTKTVVGVVAGTAASASGSIASGVAGSYGTVTINADGSYSYSVDNSNSMVQALRTTGNTLSDVFTYTMQDTAGADSTATLTVTIQGTNDDPTAVADTATAIEAGGISNSISGTDPTGNVLTNDTDVDAGDTKTVIGVALGVQPSASGSVGVSVAGNYGSIQLNANGTYAYTLDNNNAAVEALNAGDTLTETFTYTLSDTAGGESTSTLQITIDGRDDLPFAVVDFATAVEDGGLNNATAGSDPTGNVFTNDVTPNGNTLTGVAAGVQTSASGSVGVAVAGSYGSIVIDASGNYAYTLDNLAAVVEALRTSGDHLTDVFTYTFEDALSYESSTQVTISIDGSNDNPLSSDDSGIAVEAGGVGNGSVGSDAVGNILTNDSDVDSGDTKQVVGVVAGTAGSASGSVGAAVTGSYGSIVIAANGSYTYAIDENNAAVEALRTSGDTLSEVFTYTMEDTAGEASTATATVTIQGQNDTPLAVADTATAIESGGENNGSGGTNPTGNVLTNDTDVDAGDTKTVSGVAAGVVGSASGSVGVNVNGSYGSISVDSSGNYTYTVDNSNAAVQALRTSGQTLQDVFTYTMVDTAGAASTTQITVTIQGANDAPTTTDDSATATEAGGTANGTAGSNPTGNVLTNDSDADASDTLLVSGVQAGVVGSATGNVGASVAGLYGSVQVASDGSFSYVVDNANLSVQALRLITDTLTDTFTYTAQDSVGAESTSQITITIQGQNDAPVGIVNNSTAIEAGGVNNGTAGSTGTGNVLSNDIEFDSGDTSAVSGVAAGVVGSTSGNVGAGVAGSYGSLNVAANGAYVYTVDENDASVQALRLISESITDVFSYTLMDAGGLSSTTQLTITIQGSNDTPTAVADNAIAIEAGGTANGTSGTDPSGNVLTNDTDVDAGDTKALVGVAAGIVGSASGNVGSPISGSYGDISINSSGSYVYSVDNSNSAVQALRTSSDTLSDIFTYTLQDASGAESTTQITVTIQGQNDRPHDLTDSGLTVDENAANNTVVGSVTTSDVDAGETFSYSLTDTASGRFSINSSTGDILVADGSQLNRENAGTHSITVRVADIDGLTYDESFTVTINDVDEFDVSVPTDSDTATNEVTENVSIGTTVGVTADAFDLDATNNTITYSLTSNPDGLFDIDANSGVVTTAAAINREVHGATRSITVEAASSDGSVASQSFNIAIIDVDEFDVSVPTDSDTATNEVTENVSIGATVGVTADAFDLDATNNTITYSLTSNPDGLFDIDANSGVVTTAAAINREVHGATRSITVEAASSDGSVASQSFNIAIIDVDEFDVSVPTDSDTATNEVAENISLGTTVGITADAFDLDATNNTITYSLTSNPDGLFDIDANSGIVTTAAAINREVHGATRSITVEAASSDGSVASQSFNIAIIDVDEFDVSVPSDSDTATNEVTENVSVGTTVGVTSDAFDLDATNNTITYSLTSNPDGLFDIDAGTGVVTTAAAINREVHGATRSITVQAAGSDGSVASQSFNIAIIDVDEFDVSLPADSDTATNEVTENVSIGTAVGVTADAFDLDATNNSITYSLTSNPDGLFDIDANSGVVTTAAAINREVHGATRSITVEAASSDGSVASQSFNIAIIDVDEFNVTVPTDSDTATNEVTENVSVGTTVGVTADAFDLDATNNSITYSLTSNPDGLFDIDANSGVVTTAAAINREVHGASRSITVEAASSDGSVASQIFNIAIIDVDEFNVTVPTDSDTATNEVAENVSIGTTVGVTADAFDLDATNNTITYSLTSNPDGLFDIDANSGVVTTAAAINREVHGATRSITVEAASSDGSVASQIFNIAIIDVDEFDVSVPTDSDTATNEVAENVSVGTTVGITADAFDLDATNNTITYSLTSNPDGLFDIDANSGVVTTAAAINREVHGATRSITVEAASSDGSVASQSFNIAIIDVDEFDVSLPADSDTATNEVTENVSIGTAVGVTADAFDLDATNNTITYSLTSNPDGLFDIDANSGVVTTAAAINREVHGATRSITVEAASSDGSVASQIFNIAIIDVDEFDVSVPTDSDTATNEVAENVSVGTTVGITADAFDLDATNNTITYSLTSNPDGLFDIDANSGVVTTAAAINREVHGASRSITVEAASSDGSVASQIFNIAIIDVDEFNVTVPTDSDTATNEVAENVSIGTTVGVTADAFDLDATNNTITYSLTSNPDGLFDIDANSGVVTTAASIDREVHGATRSITVEAASSDGSVASQSFNIAIIDVDEFDVSLPTDSDTATNEVAENISLGTTVGITADAFDLDATNNTITYSLTSNPDGLFDIDANSGIVTTAAAINREVHGATRSITVEAASSDGSVASQSFNIAIIDVDEFDVSVPSDSDTATNEVTENVSVGTTVGVTADAFDLDATNNTITYSLTSNPDGLFDIDVNSGVVTTAAAIDRETHGATRSITVEAVSSDGSLASRSFNIAIVDSDEFNVGPVIDVDSSANTVAENAVIGSSVGVTALATDNDATNNSIAYSLDDDAAGRFAINAATGEITVSGLLDHETDPSHNIIVRASSTDGSSSTRLFTIAVTDVSEFSATPIVDNDGAANWVAENASIGTAVGITSHSDDSDTSDTITYSLDDSDGGRFAVDAATGVVSVAGTIDREVDGGTRFLTIRAISSDGSFQTRSFAITIDDVDEFDVGAVSDNDLSLNAVNENAVGGTLVGVTAFAADADSTTNDITYTLDDNAGGRFAIDGTTGVVSVADGTLLDREVSASHNITVRATSSDGSTDSAMITINVLDVDEFDVGTIIDTNSTPNLVAENASMGTSVGITAIAADLDSNDTITYSLDDDDGGRFTINSLTGQVTVAGAIDREVDGAIRSITVRATSSDTSSSTATMLINVTDVNEFSTSPLVDSDSGTNIINEFDSRGTFVGLTIQASDADATNNAIVYSLDSDAGGIFAINSTTGQVTLANGSLLDYSAAAAHSVTVRATSADGSSQTAVFVISVEEVPLATPTTPAKPTPTSDDTSDQGNQNESSNKNTPPNEPQPTNAATKAVPAAQPVSKPAPTTDQQLPQGVFVILSDGSTTQTGDEQQAAEDRLLFMNTTLDEAVAATARRLGEAVVHGSSYRYFTPVADTVLTLAFDQQNNWDFRQSVNDEKQVRQLAVGTSAVLTSSLSVGYVYWLLRGGSLAASMFSALPAWCSFDPLPIVESFESIRDSRKQSLLTESLTNIAAKASGR